MAQAPACGLASGGGARKFRLRSLPPEKARPAPARPGQGRPAAPLWRTAVGSLSWIATICLAVMGALAMVLAVVSHLAPAGQFTVFGHPTLSVVSGSMSPTIRTGDLIVDAGLSPNQAAQLRPGQVITFLSAPHSQRVFTHRIVAVQKSTTGAVSYLTKGDDNDAADANPVPASDVIGVFRLRVPFGGYVLNALRQPPVSVFLGLALVLLAAGPLRRWTRRGKTHARVQASPYGRAHASTHA